MGFIAQGLSEDARIDLDQAREYLADAVECFYMASVRPLVRDQKELLNHLNKLKHRLEATLVELRPLIADNGIIATQGGSNG